MRYLRHKVVSTGFILAGLLCLAAAPLRADEILDATHTYNDISGGVGSIQIAVDVDLIGGLYLWQYTVTNISFNPAGSNGFSGFELALPASVSDIANVTAPNSGWGVDCCSGMPVEWDISGAPGILVGESGVFSFTTLPRDITNSTGWFHTWTGGVQTNISPYSLTGLGPEVPNVLLPPIGTPEPGTIALLCSGIAAVGVFRRRRISR